MNQLLKFEGKGLAARWTYRRLGFRAPKKGEFFVSGAIPEAYLAPNDLTTEYLVVEPVTKHRLANVYAPA